ncbi:MAG: hypothetical protein PHP75_00360, partial [Methylacidiphilaceae bacterium]|nr:hypothetical protein [Candidatus Methylacidiphilaceae bacterium]
MMSVRSTIYATVEGLVDAAVAKKLIAHVGASPGEICIKNGKTNVRKGLDGYVAAARYKPWMVLIDLD